jgi:hypothetical protein
MENGLAKRFTLSAIAAALLLGALGGAAQQTAGYALQASGGDAWAYRTTVSAMDKAAHFLTSPLFIIVACAAAGAAIYSWADFIVRKWNERWRQAGRLSFASPDRKLIAMSLMLIFGSGFVLSTLWVAVERFAKSSPPEQRLASPTEGPVSGYRTTVSEIAQRTERLEKEAAAKETALASTRQELEATKRKLETATNQPPPSPSKDETQLRRFLALRTLSERADDTKEKLAGLITGMLDIQVPKKRDPNYPSRMSESITNNGIRENYAATLRRLSALNKSFDDKRPFDFESAPGIENYLRTVPREEEFGDNADARYAYRKFYFQTENISKQTDALVGAIKNELRLVGGELANTPYSKLRDE